MKNIKEKILKLAVKQIKNTAFSAVGVTSYWLAFQPKEPSNLKR
ncbi:cyclic lactone autoinducer peptide [Sedimentibacter sp. MB31-C6]|nr:cyclic lactone autoinducer peptide [Sedimentibacter sp. MB36-C1]WSI02859.1 cyclic lactone autoinducer peptide [Sedimentibacter sp. MB36-C1]